MNQGVSFHIWILPSSPPVTMTWFLHYAAQSIRKEEKVMDKLTSSLSEWYQYDIFSRVDEGPK